MRYDNQLRLLCLTIILNKIITQSDWAVFDETDMGSSQQNNIPSTEQYITESPRIYCISDHSLLANISKRNSGNSNLIPSRVWPNMDMYGFFADAQVQKSVQLASPTYGHGQNQTLYYSASSIMIDQELNAQLHWNFVPPSFRDIADYSFCKNYINGICQCFAQWINPTDTYGICNHPDSDFSMCIEIDITDSTKCGLCKPGYSLLNTGICSSVLYCGSGYNLGVRFCMESAPMICDAGYWPSRITTNTCVNEIVDNNKRIANCQYHIISYQGATSGCYTCVTGYVVMPDFSSCRIPEVGYRASLSACRIFKDDSRTTCGECNSSASAIENDRGCTSLVKWVFYSLILKSIDPVDGYFSVKLASSDQSCQDEFDLSFSNPTKSVNCGFQQTTSLYYNYTMNFTSTYSPGIAGCTKNEHPNRGYSWDNYEPLSMFQPLGHLEINAGFYEEVQNPIANVPFNSTFFEQEYPVIGLQEIYYTFHFVWTTTSYWEDHILPTLTNGNLAYRLIAISISFFCPDNCFRCNQSFYKINDDTSLGAKCLTCMNNFILDYYGVCRCEKYSFSGNYSGWKYKPVALNGISADTANLINIYTTNSVCYPTEYLMKNNCGYCLRAWKAQISDPLVTLHVISIEQALSHGSVGYNVTIELLGSLLPADNIYEDCKNQLILYLGQFMVYSKYFSSYQIWTRDGEFRLDPTTYKFTFWIEAKSSTIMTSIDEASPGMVVVHYKVILGQDIKIDNREDCGNPFDEFDSRVLYDVSFF